MTEQQRKAAGEAVCKRKFVYLLNSQNTFQRRMGIIALYDQKDVIQNNEYA